MNYPQNYQQPLTQGLQSFLPPSLSSFDSQTARFPAPYSSQPSSRPVQSLKKPRDFQPQNRNNQNNR